MIILKDLFHLMWKDEIKDRERHLKGPSWIHCVVMPPVFTEAFLCIQKATKGFTLPSLTWHNASKLLQINIFCDVELLMESSCTCSEL